MDALFEIILIKVNLNGKTKIHFIVYLKIIIIIKKNIDIIIFQSKLIIVHKMKFWQLNFGRANFKHVDQLFIDIFTESDDQFLLFFSQSKNLLI